MFLIGLINLIVLFSCTYYFYDNAPVYTYWEHCEIEKSMKIIIITGFLLMGICLLIISIFLYKNIKKSTCEHN